MHMKIRNAAGLALVWFLMVPPNLATTSLSCRGGFEGRIFDAWIGAAKRAEECTQWGKIADFDTQFSQWSRIGTFDSYSRCEAQRGENLLKEDNPAFPGPPAMQQRCVPVGDISRT
jgi:hypothetical protein